MNGEMGDITRQPVSHRRPPLVTDFLICAANSFPSSTRLFMELMTEKAMPWYDIYRVGCGAPVDLVRGPSSHRHTRYVASFTGWASTRQNLLLNQALFDHFELTNADDLLKRRLSGKSKFEVLSFSCRPLLHCFVLGSINPIFYQSQRAIMSSNIPRILPSPPPHISCL